MIQFSSIVREIHHNCLLGGSSQDDDSFLGDRGILLAVRDVRRDEDLIPRPGFNSKLLVALQQHEYRFPSQDVDAPLRLTVMMVRRTCCQIEVAFTHPDSLGARHGTRNSITAPHF